MVKDYIKILKSRWLLIAISAALLGCVGALYAYFSKEKYKSYLSFVLSNDTKMGGLGSLAGNLGLDIGSNAEGAFTGENIILLLTSKKVVRRSLLTPFPQSTKLLVDEYMDVSGLEKKWRSNPYLWGALKFSHNELDNSPLQDSLIDVMHESIQKKALTVKRVDKKLSFYTVEVQSPSSQFSQQFAINLIDQASRLFIETKIRQNRTNLAMLQQEADSLRQLLGGSISATAMSTDKTFNLNPGLQIERTSVQRNQLQTQVLLAAYGEVVKNLMIAKINLQKETPLYQLIDIPREKLKIERKSLIFWYLQFFVLGITLSSIFIIVRAEIAKHE